jgi:hypothetical protein
MAFGTHQHLSGLFRGLLLRPHELTGAVPALGDQTFKAELARLAVLRPPFSGSE